MELCKCHSCCFTAHHKLTFANHSFVNEHTVAFIIAIGSLVMTRMSYWISTFSRFWRWRTTLIGIWTMISLSRKRSLSTMKCSAAVSANCFVSRHGNRCWWQRNCCSTLMYHNELWCNKSYGDMWRCRQIYATSHAFEWRGQLKMVSAVSFAAIDCSRRYRASRGRSRRRTSRWRTRRASACRFAFARWQCRNRC